LSPKIIFAQPNPSLYSVNLSWHDEQERSVNLSQYKDRYVILTMAYTACSSACPLTVQRLKGIEKDLGSKVGSVEFVIVTFDPERDSPKALALYKAKHNLNSKQWHFLSGTDQDTRMLAHLLEIAYEKNPKTGEIMHSNKLVLLDPQGNIKTVADGLNSDTKVIVDNIDSK
jgi:protein SCO1/2